jgi:hypothetical protein
VLGIVDVVLGDRAPLFTDMAILQDPWAQHLHDINDVQQKLPGTLESIREWFRTYKVPDGRFDCSCQAFVASVVCCAFASKRFILISWHVYVHAIPSATVHGYMTLLMVHCILRNLHAGITMLVLIFNAWKSIVDFRFELLMSMACTYASCLVFFANWSGLRNTWNDLQENLRTDLHLKRNSWIVHLLSESCMKHTGWPHARQYYM